VFENRVLRRIFGYKREEITGTGGGEDCMMMDFIICTRQQMLLG
jgi:hypothetical protein